MFLSLAYLAFAASASPQNVVSVQATYPLPRWGVAVAYDRRLHRRLMAQVALEHVASPRGYLHLPGFEESVGVSVWTGRAGEGFYALPTVSWAHNVFYQLPAHARHVVRLGLELGARVAVGSRFLVGAGLATRHGWSVGARRSVCTYDYQCAASRAGWLVRAQVGLGVRW